MPEPKSLSVADISAHNTPNDCWIVVSGKVYDITDFAPEHPGGAGIILKYAGRDATAAYDEFHAPSVIDENLAPEKYLGVLDESSITPEWIKPPPSETKQLAFAGDKPPLPTLINTFDFEEVAQKTLSKKAWAFYSSAATDLITRDANRTAFDRVGFRPRVLRNVRQVSTRARVLGCETDVPVMVSPAAMAKLVHPDGEKALAEGASKKGVLQCVSSNASFPLAEIVPSTPPSYPFFFQLYVNKDRRKTTALLQSIQSLGRVRAIFVTVDAPVAGKREADERVKADDSLSSPMSGAKAANDKQGGGLGRIMGSYIDASLSWEDIPWLRSCTDLPIVIKGVQSHMDAKMAMEYGVEGIVVSNHGGRSLDTAPPALFILLEIQRNCPEVLDSMEVFVDGGVRRGSDVLKAICLGATAVSVGRPFLYALSYGVEGVEHLIDILKDELETSMRMVGITDLSQAHPGLVNTLGVDHLIPSTTGHPYARARPKSKL
ncbi:MAG: hypothetical protein M1833_002852 [Piccolia ochrophora]|nr:MAG: hypothetical protein M1833_002852 [Piccolia ochrophora]